MRLTKKGPGSTGIAVIGAIVGGLSGHRIKRSKQAMMASATIGAIGAKFLTGNRNKQREKRRTR